MPLLKNGRVVADPWTIVADDQPLPEDRPAVISHGRWSRGTDPLKGRRAPIGIILPNTVDILAFGPAADRFALIVLQFPKFSDGRAYSQARLLRSRFGYAGELRATGQVLQDQLWHMHRSGFDAFDIPRDDAAAVYAAAVSRFATAYQPAEDDRPTALRRRLAGQDRQEAAE